MEQHHRYALSAQAASIRSAGLLLVLWLSSCASLPPDLVAANAVDVERLDSPRARIGSLYVHDDNGRLQIRGRLKKLHAGRGRIPGHLHIEVLAKDGAVLAEGVVRYYRRSAKSGVSYFSREFGVRPEDVRTVRVIHHVREESGIDDGASQEPRVSRRSTCRRFAVCQRLDLTGYS